MPIRMLSIMLLQGAGHAPPPPVPTSGAGRVLAIVGLMIVFVLACGLIVMHIRRRLLADDAAAAGPPMLLDDLRGMRKRCEISESEFEAMRARLIGDLAAPSRERLSADTRASARSISSLSARQQPHSRGRENTQRSRPGFDLTGEPLPRPDAGEAPPKPP